MEQYHKKHGQLYMDKIGYYDQLLLSSASTPPEINTANNKDEQKYYPFIKDCSHKILYT